MKEGEALLRNVKAGNEQAWQELYRRRFRQLMHFAQGFGVSPDDSEDIVQDAMIVLYEKLPSLEVGPTTQSYLDKTVFHKAMRRLRRLYSNPAPPIEHRKVDWHASPEPTPEEVVVLQEGVEHVVDAINHLPLPHRRALV